MITIKGLLDQVMEQVASLERRLAAAMHAGEEMQHQRDEANRKREAAEKLRESTANASHKLRQRAEDAEKRLGEQHARAEAAEAEARALREQVRTLGNQLDNVRSALRPTWDGKSGGAGDGNRIGTGTAMAEGIRKEDTIR